MRTTFARRVFLGAGLYGLALLVPMYFLEATLARAFPPALTHPDHYYGFLGVAVAWQLAFLLIARDVRRFRPLMPVAVLEKWLAAGAIVALYLDDRVAAVALAPALVDIALGGLFLLAWQRTPEPGG